MTIGHTLTCSNACIERRTVLRVIAAALRLCVCVYVSVCVCVCMHPFVAIQYHDAIVLNFVHVCMCAGCTGTP